MPAKQRGGATKIGKAWRASWYDENGDRRTRSGFRTKTLALEYAGEQADRVKKIRGGEIAPDGERPATVDALLDVFLERHGADVDPATKRTLVTRLKHARATFGDRRPDELRVAGLEDWRKSLSPGIRHDAMRSFRQALRWGVKRGLLERDATSDIPNPKRKRSERRDVFPFETWAEVEAVAGELDARFAAIPIVLVATGLRPEELFGLHRSDVDRASRTLSVERRYTTGMLKPGGKTPRSVRVVPLTQRALTALDAMPPRIDTPILFPAARGGYIDIEKWRHREWAPALRAAGIAHRRIYDCRHTFATWAITAGVPTLTLAQVMGTSVAQLEDTYVRWLKQTAESVRAILEAADAAMG
jgi:integrase